MIAVFNTGEYSFQRSILFLKLFHVAHIPTACKKNLKYFLGDPILYFASFFFLQCFILKKKCLNLTKIFLIQVVSIL